MSAVPGADARSCLSIARLSLRGPGKNRDGGRRQRNETVLDDDGLKSERGCDGERVGKGGRSVISDEFGDLCAFFFSQG